MTTPASSLPDLIFVSMEDWDEIWRRNQFFCAAFTRENPERRLLFVGLPRDVSHALRTGRWRELLAPARPPLPEFPHLSLLQPLKLFPNSWAVTRRLNEWLLRVQIRRAARRLRLHRPLLWLNPHYAVHLAGHLGESAVVYDITDDWTTFTQQPWLAELIRRQDAELCRRADAVIVCSERLRELKMPLTERLFLIPNGVEAEHYRTVLEGEGPLPALAAGWKPPVAGYTGSIHPDRVDTELLAAVAQQQPEITFALVGPNMLPPAEQARLAALPNVVLPGPVAYRELPAVMRAFTVCMVPHRVTPFTESLNPLKLWEYLAAGRPIVSTPVAGFRDFSEWVRLAGSAGEFAQALLSAGAEPPAIAWQRREVAAAHSWESRWAAVRAVLHGALAHHARACGAPGPARPPAADDPLLSVIIVSYNTREMTLECLCTLRTALSELSAEILLVDNASVDGSAEAVRDAFPEVQVIASLRNLGFGAANNAAMAQARGRFFLLLNSDAFPVGEALPRLLEHLRAHPELGAAGPRLLNRDGSLQVSCWKFPGPGRSWVESLGLAAAFPRHPWLGDYYRWPHDRERAVDFVVGACLLVRREVYEEVGGFDPRFFMYAEETDWQKRIRAAGWGIGFTPGAEVTHWGGASGHGRLAPVQSHFYRSMDLYLRKHHGPLGLAVARAGLSVGAGLRAVLWGARGLFAPQPEEARERARRYAALAWRQASWWKGSI